MNVIASRGSILLSRKNVCRGLYLTKLPYGLQERQRGGVKAPKCGQNNWVRGDLTFGARAENNKCGRCAGWLERRWEGGGLKRAAALLAARLAAPSTGLPEQLSTGAGK